MISTNTKKNHPPSITIHKISGMATTATSTRDARLLSDLCCLGGVVVCTCSSEIISAFVGKVAQRIGVYRVVLLYDSKRVVGVIRVDEHLHDGKIADVDADRVIRFGKH